jgi:predicted nicotinamide N-methyase
MTGAADMDPALTVLDSRFVLATTTVTIGDTAVQIVRPRSAEELINEADFARDERLPYWADVWPSAIAMARALPTLAPQPARTLELGCGLGLVTLAALRLHHDVTATDYYVDALLFTRRNAIAATGREPHTAVADWRAWPDALAQFDLVLASDVLYERQYAPIVADVIMKTLATGGTAFVADPGRVAVGEFRRECAVRGLQVSERARVPFEDGAIRQVITIHEIRGRAC